MNIECKRDYAKSRERKAQEPGSKGWPGVQTSRKKKTNLATIKLVGKISMTGPLSSMGSEKGKNRSGKGESVEAS